MATPQQNPLISFYMPSDAAMRAALGEVSVRHSQLDYILRLTVKSIAGISLREALEETEFQSSGSLKKRIMKLAKRRLGQCEALDKLDDLISRCTKISEKRNDCIHGVYVRFMNGEQRIGTPAGWQKEPTVADLTALSRSILKITRELNTARRKGFLAEALALHS